MIFNSNVEALLNSKRNFLLFCTINCRGKEIFFFSFFLFPFTSFLFCILFYSIFTKKKQDFKVYTYLNTYILHFINQQWCRDLKGRDDLNTFLLPFELLFSYFSFNSFSIHIKSSLQPCTWGESMGWKTMKRGKKEKRENT